MRWIKLGLFLMLLAAGGAAAALYLHLNAIVKRGVEAFTPLVTRTTVRLKAASISPFTGRGALKGFVIGNAEGFPADTSFGLRNVQVFVELSTLADPKILIHEIIVDSPIIIHESGPLGDNLEQIRRNIETFVPPANVDLKLEIGLFLVKNAKVRATLALENGKESFVMLPVPTIVVTDIGRGAGATPKEAATQVLGAFVAGVQKTVNEAKAKKGKELAALQAAAKEKDSSKGGLVRGIVETGLNFVVPWLPLAKRLKGIIDAARQM